MRETLKYHMPPILYAAAILAVSSIPNLKTPEAGTWPLDKLAHLIEYAGLAILVYRSSVRWRWWSRPELARWPTFMIPVGWSLLDEWWQGYIPGRFSDPLDILADTAGAALVVGILCFRRRGRSAEKA